MSVEREVRDQEIELEPSRDDEEAVDGEEARPDRSPSSADVALMSVLAFVAIVLAGAGIGLFRSDASLTGGDRAPARIVTAAVESALDTVTVIDPPAAVAAVASIEQLVVDPELVENVDESVLTQAARAVQESAVIEPKPLVMLELPRAEYDRFELSLGDSIATNIAANDKVGGVFESVRLTGWGELAPGLALDPDGALSGTASECGDWQAQYELISDNPASETSFIDITVRDCVDIG